jgi:16S rRNA processing protein RimM
MGKEGSRTPPTAKSRGLPAAVTVRPRRRHPDHLLVGKIVGTWGKRGELKVQVLSSYPERFVAGMILLVGSELLPKAVKSVRWDDSTLYITLEGIEDLSAAEGLVGAELWIPFEARHPLAPEEYYLYEILGNRVVTEDGRYLGTVEEVIQTPANDVYVVRGRGQEYLIPALKEVVIKIDPEDGLMVVRLLPGLDG